VNTIIKSSLSNQPFLQVVQNTVRDKNLSFRARGILLRLLSNVNGYSMTSKDLVNEGVEGRDAIRSAIVELKTAGYIISEKSQDLKGRWTTKNIIFDTPQLPVIGGDAKIKIPTTASKPLTKKFGNFSCTYVKDPGKVGRFEVGAALLQKLKANSPAIEDIDLFIKQCGHQFDCTNGRNKVARGQWTASRWLSWKCAERQDYLGDVACFGKAEADRMQRMQFEL
jgi:hypothetical protein